MIFGIGCDIVQVKRFSSWVSKPELLKRFFSEEELYNQKDLKNISDQRLWEYYAVRFAAKEAFSKALGTGLKGFSLRELCVKKEKNGRPFLCVKGNAKKLLEEMCSENICVHLSLSHEKEYAIAYVIIETF